MSAKQTLRCAIYTRKSSEEGLEQDFNSLHAQREACESFIKSQKHEGWILHPAHYDDGGFSGGNMQRPALKELMDDITARKIHVVVVYKVDRLTRSLADFAKIVECFDGQGVSFVSVTQQFNTTSSMGRLTLNVLLSFAQFEREVTGERIRDKFAASKKKGMWMGGYAPLGYDILERKLIINPAEAETVRMIYQRYLELKNVRLLQESLAQQNILSKKREKKIRAGGCIFSRGALYSLLTQPVYIGQIRYKDTCYPGQHEGIIEQELWDRVQQQLSDNTVKQDGNRKTDRCFFMGKLFDESGERLTPSHAITRQRRYRYYISQHLTLGLKSNNKSGWRLSAPELEQTILHLAKCMLNDHDAVATALQEAGIAEHHIPAALNAAEKISKHMEQNHEMIERVNLLQEGINITLSLAILIAGLPEKNLSPVMTRHIPMRIKRRGVEMRLVINSTASKTHIDPVLIRTIARAHVWSEELLSGRVPSMTEIASRSGVSNSYVKKLMPLAFLAPDIIEAIIAGKQPAHLTTQMLIRQISIPLDWEEQKRVLEFKD